MMEHNVLTLSQPLLSQSFVQHQIRISHMLIPSSFSLPIYLFFFSFLHTFIALLYVYLMKSQLGFSGYKILTFFCYIHMVSFLYHHSFSFEMVDMRKEGSLQGINHLYNGSLLARYIQQQYQEVIQVMFNQQNSAQ